jgi:hypothetical protein
MYSNNDHPKWRGSKSEALATMKLKMTITRFVEEKKYHMYVTYEGGI